MVSECPPPQSPQLYWSKHALSRMEERKIDKTLINVSKDYIMGLSYYTTNGCYYYCDVKNMDISVQKKIINMDIEYYKNTGINQESDFINKLYSSVTGIETVGGISKKGHKKTRDRKKTRNRKETRDRKKTRNRKETRGRKKTMGGGSRKSNRHKKTTRRHKKTNYELYKDLILNYKKS